MHGPPSSLPLFDGAVCLVLWRGVDTGRGHTGRGHGAWARARAPPHAAQVDALRAVGIPARLAGTPAWNQAVQHGNHNWVEVWVDGAWQFIEARPAGGGETFTNPCDK